MTRVQPVHDMRIFGDDAAARGEHAHPSSEMALHVAVYERRADVAAVLHAHPPAAVACSIAGVDLGEAVVPESVLALGDLPTVPYATPTTDDLPAAATPHIGKRRGLLLARHGTLTVGPDLMTAFCRLETIEHTARILCLARQLGPVQPLAPAEVERLREIAGLQGDHEAERLVARITEAVMARLSTGATA